MKTTYFKNRPNFGRSILFAKVTDRGSLDIADDDISVIYDDYEDAINYYKETRNYIECTRKEFDEAFKKTVKEINEISAL